MNENADEIGEQNEKQRNRRASAPDEPIHVEGQSHFESLIGDAPVVLVDFFADWCGPCEMVEPVVEEIAAETDAAVAKVDIDEHQNLAAEFGVRSIPTLIFFAEGDQVEQLVGVQEKDRLLDVIGEHT